MARHENWLREHLSKPTLADDAADIRAALRVVANDAVHDAAEQALGRILVRLHEADAASLKNTTPDTDDARPDDAGHATITDEFSTAGIDTASYQTMQGAAASEYLRLTGSQIFDVMGAGEPAVGTVTIRRDGNMIGVDIDPPELRLNVRVLEADPDVIDDKALAVACPECDADPDVPCADVGAPHASRVARNRNTILRNEGFTFDDATKPYMDGYAFDIDAYLRCQAAGTHEERIIECRRRPCLTCGLDGIDILTQGGRRNTAPSIDMQAALERAYRMGWDDRHVMDPHAHEWNAHIDEAHAERDEAAAEVARQVIKILATAQPAKQDTDNRLHDAANKAAAIDAMHTVRAARQALRPLTDGAWSESGGYISIDTEAFDAAMRAAAILNGENTA